ncbi:MAG: hypothetical protein IJW99_04115 [Clostridia bacterium]|nr:hypothetical protein [Clostridia bacterium]
MKPLTCLRCDTEMNFLSEEYLQLGKTGWILGDLPNLIAGAMKVVIYICPSCKKLEFYAGENIATDDELPQKTCPRCGTVHDFDYPKCPNCKFCYE